MDIKKNPVAHSFGHAALVLVYVSLVAFVMSHANQFFGPKDTSITPVAVLMLLVLSATVTSTLVLGRPILMYYEGKKKEGLQFLAWTVGWLFILTISVFVVMATRR